MNLNTMKLDDIAKLAYLVENEGYFTARIIDEKTGIAMTGKSGCFIAIHAQALKKLLDKQSGEYFMLAVEFNDNQEQASAEANNEPTTFDINRTCKHS
ncbi:MAG: hypothetical protein IJ725_04000 [Ruminococcus sp.]|nr:hypothetical protein [Alphaproteobacteria bacterium]MBQ8693376.1 hypothetical protein [Synergistaceae bacterium]MBR1602886.1 hypothetical protein [Synergistaceae bacterium]MBR1731574.1 hypothetical protein [Ruminococcus sp.]